MAPNNNPDNISPDDLKRAKQFANAQFENEPSGDEMIKQMCRAVYQQLVATLRLKTQTTLQVLENNLRGTEMNLDSLKKVELLEVNRRIREYESQLRTLVDQREKMQEEEKMLYKEMNGSFGTPQNKALRCKVDECERRMGVHNSKKSELISKIRDEIAYGESKSPAFLQVEKELGRIKMNLAEFKNNTSKQEENIANEWGKKANSQQSFQDWMKFEMFLAEFEGDGGNFFQQWSKFIIPVRRLVSKLLGAKMFPKLFANQIATALFTEFAKSNTPMGRKWQERIQSNNDPLQYWIDFETDFSLTFGNTSNERFVRKWSKFMVMIRQYLGMEE